MNEHPSPSPQDHAVLLLNPDTNRSPAIRAILSEADHAAPFDATVLITGESGSGKEILAHYIHFHSLRAGGPFIRMNCGGMSDGLTDNELFGHEKGAFTNAGDRYLGHYERADKGTLFLDEIGDMPLSAQVRLLRVLQNHEFERLGGSATLRADVRVLAAANRPLAELTVEGRLREDLYYRLAVVVLEMPPLRARREDIIPLARFFMRHFAGEGATPVEDIAPEAVRLLEGYAWPGNVRELSNVIERAVIMNTGPLLRPESLPANLTRPLPVAHCTERQDAPEHPLREGLRAVEKELLAEALARNRGNKAGTARELGMSRGALLHKLEKYFPDKNSL